MASADRSISASVVDQFETVTATVVRPKLFCNPVDKNGEGIPDPDTHLTCYRIRLPRSAPRSVMVEDQFTNQDLQAFHGTCRRAALLCVPTEKNPGASTTTTTLVSTTKRP